MKFTPTSIAGAFLIELEPHADHRGSFARSFCAREFAEHGLKLDIVQCNLARTRYAGVIRGLHFQIPPAAEHKLVRCVTGAVFDALVDMRENSPTYRATYWVRLDTENRSSLFVPAGVAHGYQALLDNTEFQYMTNEYYAPGAERGVRYSDPALAIPWPLPERDVTERDKGWPLLS